MTAEALGAKPAPPRKLLVPRHSLAVRVTHWINFLCLLMLLMSGLQIFNAHTALYWGKAADFDRPVLSTRAEGERGVTTVLGRRFDTTGVLGRSSEHGRPVTRGFPAWATIPSYRDLGSGRHWHFFFAWVFVINCLAYAVNAVVSRHFGRDLWPNLHELRHIPHHIWEHARLRFPKGEAARRYNVLQKLAYLAVLLVLLPSMILSGLTMSPGMDAAWPWLVDLFGGRQSARLIHFVSASLIVAFFVLHIVMVVLAGPINEIRSMITGRYAIDAEGDAP